MPFALLLWLPAIVLVSYFVATLIVMALPWIALALVAFAAFIVFGAWATK